MRNLAWIFITSLRELTYVRIREAAGQIRGWQSVTLTHIFVRFNFASDSNMRQSGQHELEPTWMLTKNCVLHAVPEARNFNEFYLTLIKKRGFMWDIIVWGRSPYETNKS